MTGKQTGCFSEISLLSEIRITKKKKNQFFACSFLWCPIMSETPDSVNTLTRNTLIMSETPDSIPDYEPNKKETPRHHFVWWMIIMLTYLHTASIYGLYLVFTSSAKLATLIFVSDFQQRSYTYLEQ
uniref:Uncharacterized protein n=1 Tax=Cacopsylla melanoneura TaxID=428564 RepID=A0A8D8QSI4_9HEMI